MTFDFVQESMPQSLAKIFPAVIHVTIARVSTASADDRNRQ
jgi:hypothetical protein